MTALAEAPALALPPAGPARLLAACPTARLEAALAAIGRLEAALPWARLSAGRQRRRRPRAGQAMTIGGGRRRKGAGS
jgi:hypothetical protein